jgi:hypothetical protein
MPSLVLEFNIPNLSKELCRTTFLRLLYLF